MFMEHSGEQLLDLLICVGFGVILGLWLDLLTLLTPTRAPRWVAAVRDAAAVVIAAMAFFLLSLPLTAGRLRWYLFAGAGLGLWAYHATLHRAVWAIGCRVRRWLVRVARFFGGWYDRLLVRPPKRLIQKAAFRMKARRKAKPSHVPRRPKKSRSKAKNFQKTIEIAEDNTI